MTRMSSDPAACMSPEFHSALWISRTNDSSGAFSSGKPTETYSYVMGFSLIFMRVQGDAEADADRDGLASFLQERELEVGPSDDNTHHLTGPEGDLTFDGEWTDLHLDPLDQEKPVTGGIWHATLGADECTFIYDLCVAGRLCVFNPQGSPMFLVPGHTHRPAEMPDDVEPQEIAWVDSADELEAALNGDFENFVHYREQVTGETDHP